MSLHSEKNGGGNADSLVQKTWFRHGLLADTVGPRPAADQSSLRLCSVGVVPNRKLYLIAAVKTSSMSRLVRQPEEGTSWRRLSVQIGWDRPPKETSPS